MKAPVATCLKSHQTVRLVWEYITAYSQFGAATQGENPFGNSTFRAYRYAPDYAAFEGRDMTPGDPVELNPLPFDCALYPAPVDTTTGIPQPRLSAPLVCIPQPFKWWIHHIQPGSRHVDPY